MKSLIIISVFVVVLYYVNMKTSAPIVSVPLLGAGPTAPPSNAPSVGPSDGGNTFPGMMGNTYTPVPGSPGLLMPVINSTFAPGVPAQYPNPTVMGVRATPRNVV